MTRHDSRDPVRQPPKGLQVLRRHLAGEDMTAGRRRRVDTIPVEQFAVVGGFVINTYARPSSAYLKLHHATCPTTSRLQPGARTFTDGQYSKLCGSRAELEEHAHRLGGTAQPCPLCL